MTVVVDVRGVPEIVWQARVAMAVLLRREAKAEVSPAVALRLLEIAARFEAGQ